MRDSDGLSLEGRAGENVAAVLLSGESRFFYIVREASVGVKSNGVLHCVDNTLAGSSEVSVIDDAAEANIRLDMVDMSELDGRNGESVKKRPAISLSLPTITLEDGSDMTADFKSSS